MAIVIVMMIQIVMIKTLTTAALQDLIQKRIQRRLKQRLKLRKILILRRMKTLLIVTQTLLPEVIQTLVLIYPLVSKMSNLKKRKKSLLKDNFQLNTLS